MRHRVVLLAAFVAACLACQNSTSPASDQPTTPTVAAPCALSNAAAIVTATDSFTFSPATVTITAGQSVCWQNRGTQTHIVTDWPSGRFAGTVPAGQSFITIYGFGTGTFTYRCGQHANMTGTVIVR